MLRAEEPAAAPAAWNVGVNEGGGGFYLSSPDKAFMMKLMGFTQVNFKWRDAKSAHLGVVPPAKAVTNEFYIKRARLDWAATLYGKDEFFVEIDAGVANSATNDSELALVIARWNHKFDDKLQLMWGKTTTPFSSENLRSSRSLDTVERYIALNTLFGYPALDSQTGAQLWGKLPKDALTYYLGVWNGNGKASDNLPENNVSKELQAKVVAKPMAGMSNPMSSLSLGLGGDWSRELAGSLSLKTLGGSTVLSSDALVEGPRTGLTADFALPFGKAELRGEAIAFNFRESEVRLTGGYVQAKAIVYEGANGMAITPLLRAEQAVVSDKKNGDQKRLSSLTVGINTNLNKNVMWIVDYIPSYSKGMKLAGSDVPSHYDEVLTQVQVKF